MKTVIQAVFLIKSPLQLLNAREARHHFGLKGEECLLLHLADRKSRGQIEAMIRHGGDWPHAHCLSQLPLVGADPLDISPAGSISSRLGRSRELAFRRLSRLARRLGKVATIFIGDYRELSMRHLANILPHRETVLLDDGTATLTIAEARLQGLVQGRPASAIKRLKHLLKRRLFGVCGQELEALTFFSAYDFRTLPADRLIANSYDYLRQQMGSREEGREIFFLGSPLVESGILDEAAHLAHLNGVRNHFAGERLVYIAHRRELSAWLQQVESGIGLEVRRFEFPIEYQLAMVGPRPKVLASFISSALGNCQLIFGSTLKITAFRLQPGTYGRKEAVDRVYGWYEGLSGQNFRVEKLPPLTAGKVNMESGAEERCQAAVSPLRR